MSIEIRVPSVGESIKEVQIGRWLKKPGDKVTRDENLVEIETDKASVELPSPATGVIGSIVKRDGDLVAVGDIIATIIESGEAAASTAAAPAKPVAAAPAAPTQAAPAAASPAAVSTPSTAPAPVTSAPAAAPAPLAPLAPAGKSHSEKVAVEKVAVEKPAERSASGLVESRSAPVPRVPEPARTVIGELEEVVPMSLIRRRIAERLVEAQQTAALLTTFNEVDMSAVMQLRAEFKDAFQQQYGVKLGFMSFFVKAVIDGLKKCPELNAEIRNNREIVYRNFYDIGIAIGGGRGLVVPILRRAELMSFAQIEAAIADFGKRAQENKIAPEELVGGTFTISNGGVYGSLLSTPIVNPPQSGILGMHTIQERPVARNGQVVIRPMMYLALTYDHRIVDGREAVGFLKRVKDVLEEPSRMLMEV
ncbi:MAG: 2-oxoglutarate dehydrogenase complex dihydrolipoyllysine-residue succinyltransferase [Planctomycetota bacterium]